MRGLITVGEMLRDKNDEEKVNTTRLCELLVIPREQLGKLVKMEAVIVGAQFTNRTVEEEKLI